MKGRDLKRQKLQIPRCARDDMNAAPGAGKQRRSARKPTRGTGGFSEFFRSRLPFEAQGKKP